MVARENKNIVYRYAEAVSQGNLDAFDELLGDRFIDHTAPPDYPVGREGLKQFFSELRTAFPDLQVSVDDIVAEGDTVAIRFTFTGTHRGEFMGIPPTGTPAVGAGMDFFRIEGGQIIELWGIEDVFGLLQQLGSLSGAEST